ncbi:phage major capsid protein [Lysobacter sp. F6437]|uniref:phage major capsid protein n=1 Tax=Lysobacter sp. F6437 TaxID=3459296 RepID=UPI00403DF92A
MKFNTRWVLWALVAVALCALVAFDASAGMLVAPAAAVALDDLPELASEFKKARDEFGTKSNELSAAIAKVNDEIKNHGKASDETKGLIEELGKKHEKAETEFEARLHAIEQAGQKAANDEPERKSLGQMFVESDGLKEFAAKQWHKGQSTPMELKDITSTAASAGDGIWSYRDPDIVGGQNRPLMLRSLIPTVPVGSNLVEWVQTLVRTNSADAVSETGTKPKSDLTYDRKETAVRKIAHYFKTSSEVLADFPRLQAEINTEGFEMLRQVEEDQLLDGDGTGVNLLGLVPQATGFDYSAVESGDTRVDVLRRAILQVRQSYFSASGIVLNPADWAAIELMKDSENRYLFSSATNGAQARLWGLPVVESDALAEGEFLVGAFRQAATIYDRMQAAVYLSTENEDDFIKNMVSILFEERLALAVKRPLAFRHGNLSGSSV